MLVLLETRGPVSFADVVRRTINEVKGSEEPDTRVRNHGRTRVIKNEEVLVLKPRCPEGASATPSSVSVDGLINVPSPSQLRATVQQAVGVWW